jgi:hypothetical protein
MFICPSVIVPYAIFFKQPSTIHQITKVSKFMFRNKATTNSIHGLYHVVEVTKEDPRALLVTMGSYQLLPKNLPLIKLV